MLSLKRISILCIIFAGIQFIIITILIMIIYPGGYSFWGNSFSQLGQTTANGQSNITGYILFATTCIITAFLTIPFWLTLRTVFKEKKLLIYLSWLGTILGLIAAPFLALLAIFPRDLLWDPHILSTRLFFIFYASAIVIYSIAIIFHKNYENIYALIGIVIAIFNLIYILILQFQIYGAAIQKIAVYATILWSDFQCLKLWRIVDHSS